MLALTRQGQMSTRCTMQEVVSQIRLRACLSEVAFGELLLSMSLQAAKCAAPPLLQAISVRARAAGAGA